MNVEQLYNQGMAHYQRNHLLEAKDCFLKANSLVSNDPQITRMLATIFAQLGNFQQARPFFEAAIKYSPEEPPIRLLNNYALLLKQLGETEQSIELYKKIIARDTGSAEAWINLGGCYNKIFELSKALECFEKAREIWPDEFHILSRLNFTSRSLCMWDKAEEMAQRLTEIAKSEMAAGRASPVTTHSAFLFSEDGAFLKQIAESRTRQVRELQKKAGMIFEAPKKRTVQGRIRVGYLSAALFRHATAYLIHEMFSHHNRDEFEVFVYALDVTARCPYFDRIKETTEHLHVLNSKNELEIANFVRSHELDVLIDLDGAIRSAKPDVFAMNPAPIQINWLGTPCTTGASWMDYILTDEIIAPKEYEDHYTEKNLRMLDSFFFNSFSSMKIQKTKREQWGLPVDKFVFASFNVNRKIDRKSFETWCEVLTRVDNSILWMLVDDEGALKNLRAAMKDYGVDPDRLIPANRLDIREHVSRLEHADLMLDGFICGAHTTCIEALFANLPVLTCPGETFPSRVAASILKAADMDELVVSSREEFIEKAVEIANSPIELRRLKNHLEDNKDRLPIFDQKKWVQNFEDILYSLVKEY